MTTSRRWRPQLLPASHSFASLRGASAGRHISVAKHRPTMPASLPSRTMTSNFLASVDAKGKTFEVEIRPDGFFNATKMCKTGGKDWNAYERNQKTKEFLKELSSDLECGMDGLIDSQRGGNAHHGTWVHQMVRDSRCLIQVT